MLNGCPPCSFRVSLFFLPSIESTESEEPQLENEELLVPSRLGCMDGNNSLKRFASAGTEDGRTFHSDYFLSREDVDRFAFEVKGRMGDQPAGVRRRICK